jgi:hypothetical protein
MGQGETGGTGQLRRSAPRSRSVREEKGVEEPGQLRRSAPRSRSVRGSEEDGEKETETGTGDEEEEEEGPKSDGLPCAEFPGAT